MSELEIRGNACEHGYMVRTDGWACMCNTCVKLRPPEEAAKIGKTQQARVETAPGAKATNPKDIVGVRKARWFSYIPLQVLVGVGLALLEGARKYGRQNYREIGVTASVYVDAVICGHLTPWFEGQDIDPASGVNHIDKALAGLIVLRDSMLQGNWIDDRPIRAKGLDLAAADLLAVDIIERYPDAKLPYTQVARDEQEVRASAAKQENVS